MMSRLRRGPQPPGKSEGVIESGFTIIETMIVLAITGILFVMIAGTISARQNRVQFNQAINQVKGEFESIINQVQSGRFPDKKAYRCGPPQVTGFLELTINNPNSQGTNKDCIFLGKVLQFGKGYGSEPERYAVHSMAASREATSLLTSYATPLQDLREDVPLYNGLTASWVRYEDAANVTQSIGSVGILSYLGGEDTDLDGSVDSPTGSQTAQIVPIRGTVMDEGNVSSIMYQTRSSETNPASGVRICFKSGTTNQSGLITLGGRGTSAVALDIKQNSDCN